MDFRLQGHVIAPHIWQLHFNEKTVLIILIKYFYWIYVKSQEINQHRKHPRWAHKSV